MPDIHVRSCRFAFRSPHSLLSERTKFKYRVGMLSTRFSGGEKVVDSRSAQAYGGLDSDSRSESLRKRYIAGPHCVLAPHSRQGVGVSTLPKPQLTLEEDMSAKLRFLTIAA